jgi:hypothetical protein
MSDDEKAVDQIKAADRRRAERLLTERIDALLDEHRAQGLAASESIDWTPRYEEIADVVIAEDLAKGAVLAKVERRHSAKVNQHGLRIDPQMKLILDPDTDVRVGLHETTTLRRCYESPTKLMPRAQEQNAHHLTGAVEMVSVLTAIGRELLALQRQAWAREEPDWLEDSAAA